MNDDMKKLQIVTQIINIRHRIIGLVIVLASICGFYISMGILSYLFYFLLVE